MDNFIVTNLTGVCTAQPVVLIAIAGIPVDALSKTATATICGQVCTQVSAIFVLLQYDMRRILGRTNGDGSQKVRK
ncbi:uncharacterized protein PHALS_07497 [Plasmopara halstedii]|uniref:Uncharacterized protein n=1 Tax=Plasmopara halstedii TaxID=4781 RepID=A0A0P1B4M8_PLAHL|nr:uncharacterized protein PHALS_07497 [Plasmopara halstedii]CEG49750.1 hypothetical protein PHALS_07497 [Plasmopara halstedii]|eukprot:XP_024586119.1 hypothetical protein PHALS_07497 [Plasmopara halstedii]